MRAHWERYCFWNKTFARRGGVVRDRHRYCEGLIRLWKREIVPASQRLVFRAGEIRQRVSG